MLLASFRVDGGHPSLKGPSPLIVVPRHANHLLKNMRLFNFFQHATQLFDPNMSQNVPPPASIATSSELLSIHPFDVFTGKIRGGVLCVPLTERSYSRESDPRKCGYGQECVD